MKRILFVLVTLLATVSLQAKVISPNDARKHALRFCEQSSAQQSYTDMRLAYTMPSAKDKAVNSLYVFNKPKKKGFVIVSADDTTPQTILGYTDNGEFDYEKMPDGLKWLLSVYAEQIDYLKASGKNYTNNQTNSESDSIIVPPLLGDLMWTQQEEPYYNQCPVINDTVCPVGCVATSMTSIMYFHKWPIVGQGYKSYTDSKGCKRSFSVDFSQSKYDWANILPRYTCNYTEAQANAIAKLSLETGVSVEMQYALDGSGAHSQDIKPSLINYFKYNSDIIFNYSLLDKDNILKVELDNLRPISYCGDIDDGGHAFVCDGYTKNNYFHFNFGWGGMANGYYLSTLTDEYAVEEGCNFSQNQVITYNIQPDNKRYANGLYYHILSSSEVEVCPPKSFSEYAGDIVIPSTVKIDGTTYNVTRIGCAAFGNCTKVTSITLPESITLIEGNSIFGCTNLQTLIVPWQTPLKVYSTTFFEYQTSRTTLQVPVGALSAYTTAEGWNQFTKVTDGSEAVSWTEWTPFEGGKCSFVQSSVFETTYKNLDIYKRTSLTDATKSQILVTNHGILKAANLIVNWDTKTNKCQVEKQEYGYYQSNYGMSYVSDIPHYSSNYSYDKFPCQYNSKTGDFELNLVYYVDAGIYGNGLDYIKIDKPVEYDLSVEFGTSTLQEASDGSATEKIRLILGLDVAYAYYSTVEGELSETELNTVVNSMIAGTISHKEVQPSFRAYANMEYPKSGKYTTVFITFTSDGENKNVSTYVKKYVSSKDKGNKGDANDDGTVDVADITAIASYILGTTPEAWNAENSDANDDGTIDVADITATASIILGN